MNDVSTPVSVTASLIVHVVGRCVAHAWIIVTAVIILCVALAHYVTTHFAMNTDTYALLSPKLPWRVRQAAFDAAFPQDNADIVVVVDGQTPELSEAAAAGLATSLSAQPKLLTRYSDRTVDHSGHTIACCSPRPRR